MVKNIKVFQKNTDKNITRDIADMKSIRKDNLWALRMKCYPDLTLRNRNMK